MCIEWRRASKVLLMCPSVSHPSINHGIRQRHISLRTRSERKKCFHSLAFDSPLEDRNTLFLSCSPSVSVSFEDDCHIRIVCQSEGNSDNAESIYLSISGSAYYRKDSKISESKRHPDPTSCNSPPLAPRHSLPLR